MAQYELNIRDYWRILKKRKFIIILTFFSTIIATHIYNSFQIPIYQAIATIRIEPRRTYITALTDQILGSTGDYLATEERVIQSQPILDEAAIRAGLIGEDSSTEERQKVASEIGFGLSTARDKYANLISIIVTSNDPAKTRDMANKIAEVFLEEHLKHRNKQARQIRTFIEQQMNDVEKNLRNAEEKVKQFREKEAVTGAAVSLGSELASLRSELADLLTKATEMHPDVIRIKGQIQRMQEQLKLLPASELEFARLSRDVGIHEGLYRMLRSRFEEAKIAEASQTSDAILVSPALKPRIPIRPNKKFALIMGMTIGAMMSLILAFVTENLDTSIGTIEDVESLLKVPVLVIIPSVKAEEREGQPWWRRHSPFSKKSKHQSRKENIRIALLVHLKPLSQIAEAYRLLRTNLKISEDRRIFLITSCGPREGKTTILIGLAITLAQMGTKTLLVDTDLRRPSIHKLFGIDKEPGLSEIITASVKWQDTVKNLTDIMMGDMRFDDVLQSPGLDNLNIITSGHVTSSPSELLSSKAMTSLIAELKDNYEVVLFDTPPALSITDAAILAPKAQGVILAYEMGRTARNALLRAKIQLESVGANVLGTVLNHIRPETYVDTGYYPYYYHYKYKYRYYREQAEDEGKTKKEGTK